MKPSLALTLISRKQLFPTATLSTLAVIGNIASIALPPRTRCRRRGATSADRGGRNWANRNARSQRTIID